MSKTETSMTGRTVLFWLIGFFLCVFIVNGTMVWLALDSWSGLETEDAYRKGLAYNDQIHEAQRQAASGWAITLAARPEYDKGDHLRVSLTFPQGAVPPESLQVRFVRPTAEGYDHDIILTPAAGRPGQVTYNAPILLPLPGVWDMEILAKTGTDLKYTLRDRLVVKPSSDE